jgi:hypothetical protein
MPDDLQLLPVHGRAELRGLRIDAYGLALPGAPSPGGFDALLTKWRARLRANGGRDPWGDVPVVDCEMLDAALSGSAPEAARLVQGAMAAFAEHLAATAIRLLALPGWEETQRLLVGGELRSAWIGDIAVARAAQKLRAEGFGVTLGPIRHAPGEAALVGAARLLPHPLLETCDVVPVAELGPEGFRAGLVLPRLGVAPGMAAAGLWRWRAWRHAGERTDRAAAIGQLAGMLADLLGDAAAAGLSAPPVVAVAVPGVPDAEGRLGPGAEGLPGGDWAAEEFRLPAALGRLLPPVAGTRPAVLLHNEAVVQGLSEAPFQRDVARWGVMTLGSGFGNARFTNLPMRD